MSNTRTENTTKNAMVGMIVKILTMVIQLICRTIFIKTLATEYLGINGLFTNILTILSFAELGIGNAIIFKLYKPIAENDKEKIKSYVHFYKKVYIIIGTFILLAGICVIPFLKYIVDAPDIKESITLIYILFLINSAISYFFTYKKSIITGNQKEYIISIIDFVCRVIQNIIQIVILLVTHDFLLYLITQIIFTFISNFVASMIASKMYPYIDDKNYTKLAKEDEKNIFNDVKSLIIYKFGSIIADGTDNIIISAFVGVTEVGLLSNYTTITTSLNSLVTSFFSGFTASVGNLNAVGEEEKKESIYYQIFLLSFWVYGIVTVGTILLINPLIEIWIGKDYLLSFSVCFALGLNIYVNGMRFANYTFRNTMGLFKKGRLVPLISALTNITLSLILVRFWGIFGVLIATVIARIFIMTSVDPYLLHKYRFKSDCKKFYIRYIYFFAVLMLDLFICKYVTSLITTVSILTFIIKGIIVCVISGILFYIATLKMKESKLLFEKIKMMFLNKLKVRS